MSSRVLRFVLMVVLGASCATVPAVTRPALSMEQGVDRPGSDYKDFDLSSPTPELCQTACATEQECRAYTYVKPGVQGPSARCWLKGEVPTPNPDECCVSGAKP